MDLPMRMLAVFLVVCSCRCLAEAAASSDVVEATAKLTDPSPRERQLAAMSLRRNADASAIEPLVKALQDDAASMDAAIALGRLHDRRATPWLLKYLDQELQARGKPHLCDPLRHESNLNLQCAMIEALGATGDPGAFPRLCELASDPDAGIRCSVAEALGHFAAPQPLRTLQPMLRDENTPVRVAAAGALCKSDEPEAGLALLSALEDGKLGSGLRASNLAIAEGLAKHPTPEFIQRLIPLLASNSAEQQFTAAMSLGKMKTPDAFQPLIGALKHKYPAWRKAAVEALGELGDPRAIPEIEKFQNDSWDEMRQAAAEALRKLGSSPKPLSAGTVESAAPH